MINQNVSCFLLQNFHKTSNCPFYRPSGVFIRNQFMNIMHIHVGNMQSIALGDREISSLTSAIRFPSSLRMLLSQAASSATAHMSSALTFRRSKSASLLLLLSFLQRPSVWSVRRNLANSPLSVSSASWLRSSASSLPAVSSSVQASTEELGIRPMCHYMRR